MDVKTIYDNFMTICQFKNNNNFIIKQINFFELNNFQNLDTIYKKNEQEFFTYMCKKTDAFRSVFKIKELPEPYSYYDIDSCKKTIEFNFNVIIKELNKIN